MAIQGSLETIKIPELFSLLHQLRKTGMLTLVSERDERGFIFYRGDLIYATAKDGSQQLGTFLVRLGILTPEEIHPETLRPSSTGAYLGQRLVESGRISKDDLDHAVQEQVMQLTEDVLSWLTGAFHFEENELPFAIPDGTPVSTHSIILEATSKADEREHIRKSFPDLNVILARGSGENGEGAVVADSEKGQILRIADGTRTIEQILFSSPFGEQETAKNLHELVTQDILHQVGIQVEDGLPPPVPELYGLPVAPDVPGKLFSVFNGDDYQIPKIAEIVCRDPILTAKILRILTLSSTELPRAKMSVSALVEQLGTFRLRSTLVPEAIRGLFFSRTQSFWRECWEHSLLCAQLSERIATWVEYPYPQEAYLAGLLHNLGVFILMDHDPVVYRELVMESLHNEEDIESLEEEQFGISHTKLGGVHADKWKFPRAIVLAIKAHHRIETSTQNPILDIVSVAGGIAENSGMSIGHLPSAESQFKHSLKRLRLQRKKVMALVNRVPRAVAPELALERDL